MKFIPTQLPEVVVVEPDVHRDARGFFLEAYHARKYAEGGVTGTFVQDNHSKSMRGTLRALHAQSPHAQGKLVRVLSGEIYDVAVDVRLGSPRYGRYAAVVLSAENNKQLWIPEGFAHGFCVLSETAEVEYKCTDFYHPECDLTIAWNDPDIGIPWPVERPILSDKDRRAPLLKDKDVQSRLLPYKS